MPITKTPIIPPTGSAISGSIDIPTNGLSDNKIIVTIGPIIAAKKDGSSTSSTSSIFVSFALLYFLLSKEANITVTISPTMAGIILATIKDDNSTPKFSAAAMVLGFGDIIFPALPPPIIAKSITIGEYPNFFAIARAIGATVITATSINTPTAVSIMVDNAMANSALFSPKLFTI